MGSGVVLAEPRETPHWDPDKQANGETSLRAKVRFDRLARNPFVLRKELDAEPFNAMHWDIQASGTRIHDTVAGELARLWDSRQRTPTAGELAVSPPVVRRWRARWEEAQRDPTWVERHRLRDHKRREMLPAIREFLESFLKGVLPLEEFRDVFHRRSMNEWNLFGLKGAAGMFLNTLVKDLPDSDELRAQLRACLAAPVDETAARGKLEDFSAYLKERIEAGATSTRRLSPKRIGFLASACWHMFDIEAWPPLYPSARKALEADGLLTEPASIVESYLEYRQVFRGLAGALELSSWDFEHLCDREAELTSVDNEPPPEGIDEAERHGYPRTRLVGRARSRRIRVGALPSRWNHCHRMGLSG